MVNPRKELNDEILVLREGMEQYPVGSEEYLNACKATNQLAEASQKLKRIDVNQLITGGISIGMFVLYMAFSENHITDTRAYQWAKGLFRK